MAASLDRRLSLLIPISTYVLSVISSRPRNNTIKSAADAMNAMPAVARSSSA